MSARYVTRTNVVRESVTGQGFISKVKLGSAELMNALWSLSVYLSFYLRTPITFDQNIVIENNDQSSPQPISYEKSGTYFCNNSAV
jgi:hypothetical protein